VRNRVVACKAALLNAVVVPWRCVNEHHRVIKLKHQHRCAVKPLQYFSPSYLEVTSLSDIFCLSTDMLDGTGARH